MERYALELAKKIKQEMKKRENKLAVYYGTITAQVPLTIQAMDGELVFQVGQNLKTTKTLYEKLEQDETKRAYIGREVVLMGVQMMCALDVLEG